MIRFETDFFIQQTAGSGTTGTSLETVKHRGGRRIKACLRFPQVSRDFVSKLELDLHLDERLHHLVVHVVVDFLKHEKWGSM